MDQRIVAVWWLDRDGVMRAGASGAACELEAVERRADLERELAEYGTRKTTARRKRR